MRLSEITEGYWKNKSIDNEFDRRNIRTPVKFGIMINGKTWTKSGKPVQFDDYAGALKIANKITAGRNITTQVIPLKS